MINTIFSWKGFGRVAGAALIAGTALGVAGVAVADDNYPERPVRMIVGWVAGGPADAVARTIGSELGEQLGQPVAIDNRGGAGGNIGSAAAARARADGYTIMQATVASHGLNSALYDDIGYDPIEDFAPIGLINTSPSIMLVPADSPFNTVEELVAHAKAHPGELTIASGGVGSSQHLAAASFMTRTDTDLLHIPFKSTAPAFTDLMAGRVDSIITTGALNPLSSGKVKALAVTSKERLPVLPDVPTFDEAGVPGFYMSSWYGLVAPAGTPEPVLDKLHTALVNSLENEDIRESFEVLGSVPADPISRDDFWTMVQDGMEEARELVELSGAREQR